MNARSLGLCCVLASSLGCGKPVSDYGVVCVTTVERQGQHYLVAEAVGYSCAGDNRGFRYECNISVEGGEASVTTTYVEGRESPDDICVQPMTSCERAAAPGTYAMEYRDEIIMVEVPNSGWECFEGGYDKDTGTSDTGA